MRNSVILRVNWFTERVDVEVVVVLLVVVLLVVVFVDVVVLVDVVGFVVVVVVLLKREMSSQNTLVSGSAYPAELQGHACVRMCAIRIEGQRKPFLSFSLFFFSFSFSHAHT
jgi:hypothetical protein